METKKEKIKSDLEQIQKDLNHLEIEMKKDFWILEDRINKFQKIQGNENKHNSYVDDCGGGCWTQDSLIYVQNKGWAPSSQLKEGQFIRTGSKKYSKILQIYHMEANKKEIVELDGFEFTSDHPVRYKINWFRAKTIKDTVVKTNVKLVNLRLESEHDVILKNSDKKLVVATVGKFNKDWDPKN